MYTNKRVLKYNYAALLLLFPILPQFIYVVGGLNVVNFLIVLFVISIFLSGKIVKISIMRYIPLFWIYEFAKVIFTLADAGAIHGLAYFLAFFLVPYFLVCYINSGRRFNAALDILIFGGLILGIFGIVEQITRVNIFQYLSNESIDFSGHIRYGLLRVMTTFGQPISYGLYQVFICALVYYRLNTNSEKHSRCYYICAYVVSAVNIFFSVSRTPILAFILVQTLLVFHKSKKKFVNFAFAAILLILIGGLIGDIAGLEIPLVDDIVQTIAGLFQGVTQTSEQTVGIGDRFSLWIWVAESMGDNWIFGNGAAAEFAYEVYEWQIKTSIENHYLFTLFHYGIIGVALLVAMYVSILVYTRKMDRHYGKRLSEKQISFNKVMFVVFLIYNVVELGVQETDLSRLYVVLVALLIAYNKIADHQSAKVGIKTTY